MRKFRFFVLLVCVFWSYAFSGYASHVIGGELFYEPVAPGVFMATYREYYNLSNNILALQTKEFNLRSPGCNNGWVVTGTLQSRSVQYIKGHGGSRCNAFVPMATFTATISLNNSQLACPDWYISVKECAIGTNANIVPGQNPCLYTEAYLNVQYANAQTRSPEFLPPASWVFQVNKPATYSNLTVQNLHPQDSVVYALKPALNEHNTPLTYTSNITFLQPIPTVSGVALNASTGLMTFIPNVNSSTPQFSIRYTIVVEASVYRRINGKMTRVSASQRNLPIYIENNTANAIPDLVNVTANGQPIQPNQVVQVMAGNTLTFQFGTADADPSDTLTLQLPDLQFSGFPTNTTSAVMAGKRPSGTLTFNVPISASGSKFYFPVTVTDNICTGRGITTHIYGVKILANPLGSRKEFSAEGSFSVFPNPFSENVSFRLNQVYKPQRITIYNILGQQVAEFGISKIDAGEVVPWSDAHKHAAGSYFAVLHAEGKIVQTLKFTKFR